MMRYTIRYVSLLAGMLTVFSSCVDMDCRFCKTFPKRSESVFAVSPTTCPEKILPTVFITTLASLSP